MAGNQALTIDRVRQYPEYDNHEFVMVLNDKSSGLRAFIAIHSTILGPALGGTRMKLYSSEEDALQDVLNLSKAMSYKCALANLPYGGGKAVIIADHTCDRGQVLIAYARLLEKLRGLFKTGTDVGIGDDDVIFMARHTNHMLGVIPADRGNLNPSKVAALGVFHAMKATLRELNHNDAFNDCTIAIKGAGKLGSELAELVLRVGGQVLISDINPKACDQLKDLFPQIKIIDNEQIHMQDVDIYSPCALGNEINSKIIDGLRCRAVVGGANNQLANSQAGDLLHKKGILYAPDYIANAGGLIYVADELENDGFNRRRVLARTAEIEKTLSNVYVLAKSENLPTNKIADLLALERINEATNV